MSFFCSSTRPRAYSKPTREELRELNTYLAQRNVDELRSVIHLAATQSSETAHIVLKLLNLHAHSPFQPVHVPTSTRLEHVSNDGLLTPADSEDSEMSGTENIAPQSQNSMSQIETQTRSAFPFTGFQSQSQGQSQEYGQAKALLLSPVQERRLKRKSLAEWDDNTIPTPSPSSSSSSRHTIPATTTTTTTTTFQLQQHSPSTKRRRAALNGLKDQHRQISSCVNCGKEYSSYTPSHHADAGGLHACMYHPGLLVLESVETLETEYQRQNQDGEVNRTAMKAGRWDCCRGLQSSPGCLVTQHRDVNVDGYRISRPMSSLLSISASISSSLLGCDAQSNGNGKGNGHNDRVATTTQYTPIMGARSLFAEMVAAGSLVR